VTQALIQDAIDDLPIVERGPALVAHPHWARRGAMCRRSTVYQRFRRWSEAGIREAVATALARAMADNSRHSLDLVTVAVMSRLPAQKGDSRTSF
jgi:hypothetical protein